MPRAFSILPNRFADQRHEIIENGLEAAGWRVRRGFGMPRGPKDLLVTWTVHRGPKENAARSFEAAGGRVLVCEEAYFRIVNGESHVALALHDHNGAGQWHAGGPERWESFNIPLAPWRKGGRHILLREQRGIGSTPMASPPLWHDGAARRLKGLTARPVLFRAHPKSRLYPEVAATQPSLEAALVDCHAVVTWASAIAARALVAGVPVFYEAPTLVCAGACRRGLEDIEAPRHPDRLPALERLAWAQWSLAEIASGLPFRYLKTS
ncbi:MAG: hypothetical protein V3U23_01330 [Kiloniellales bacterium]